MPRPRSDSARRPALPRRRDLRTARRRSVFAAKPRGLSGRAEREGVRAGRRAPGPGCDTGSQGRAARRSRTRWRRDVSGWCSSRSGGTGRPAGARGRRTGSGGGVFRTAGRASRRRASARYRCLDFLRRRGFTRYPIGGGGASPACASGAARCRPGSGLPERGPRGREAPYWDDLLTERHGGSGRARARGRGRP